MKCFEFGVIEGFVSVEKGNYDLIRFSVGVLFLLIDNFVMCIFGNFECCDSFYSNYGFDLEDVVKLINN